MTRKAKPVTKSKRLELRVTPGQFVEWLLAAGREGRSLSDWIRVTLDDCAAPMSGKR